MSSSESDDSLIESDADRIRRNAKSLTQVEIDYWDNVIEIFDALTNNTVVKSVHISDTAYLLPQNQEALAKLSEVMKCNKSVESLKNCLPRGETHNERNQLLVSWRQLAGRPSKSWPFTTHWVPGFLGRPRNTYQTLSSKART
jgi:hypothetical protein